MLNVPLPQLSRLLVRWLGLLALLGPAGCGPVPEDTQAVRIDDAWLRSPAPGGNMSAGYFSIHNTTSTELVLVRVSSTQTGAIELHTHIADGDMMRMRRLHQLAIPARSRVDLEPGGHHLMVADLARDADNVVVTLDFADGTRAQAQFDVRSFTPRKE